MALLNYTTQIAAEKTVGEIQKMLARAGATGSSLKFKNGEPNALGFEIETANGPLSFELPANVDGVLAALERQKEEGNCSLPNSEAQSGAGVPRGVAHHQRLARSPTRAYRVASGEFGASDAALPSDRAKRDVVPKIRAHAVRFAGGFVVIPCSASRRILST